MSSVAPRLPSSGWKILYKDALQAYLKDEAHLKHAGAVGDWIVACRENGPPTGIDAGNDVYLSRVPGTPVVAEYRIVESEFLIIVKEFR